MYVKPIENSIVKTRSTYWIAIHTSFSKCRNSLNSSIFRHYLTLLAPPHIITIPTTPGERGEVDEAVEREATTFRWKA